MRARHARRDPSHEVAKVEFYNLWERGARSPKNGWYVARYVDGRRHQTLKDWKTDEAGARAHAAELNARRARGHRRDPSTPELPEPKIIGISHRPEGAQFLVSLHTRKGKKDIVTVIVHDNGARSMTSAVRDVSTPLVASRLVTKYLEADETERQRLRGGLQAESGRSRMGRTLRRDATSGAGSLSARVVDPLTLRTVEAVKNARPSRVITLADRFGPWTSLVLSAARPPQLLTLHGDYDLFVNGLAADIETLLEKLAQRGVRPDAHARSTLRRRT